MTRRNPIANTKANAIMLKLTFIQKNKGGVEAFGQFQTHTQRETKLYILR